MIHLASPNVCNINRIVFNVIKNFVILMFYKRTYCYAFIAFDCIINNFPKIDSSSP